MKLLLRLGFKYKMLLPEGMSCLANEKWDLNELEHVHSVSMVIVSLIPRALGHIDTSCPCSNHYVDKLRRDATINTKISI